MRWPWSLQRDVEIAAPAISNQANLPQLEAAWLLRNGTASQGIVSEEGSLKASGLYRAVNLIAGTLAALPFRSYTGAAGDTERKTVSSVFDNPDPDGQTPYEWKETAFTHLLLHGRCGALKVKNAAGSLVALPLVHPTSFSVSLPKDDERPAGGLWFQVSLADGKSLKTDADGFWYVPALSLDGRNGVGLLELARESLLTTLAGDEASRSAFENGALISGLATPEDEGLDLTDDLPQIKAELRRNMLGAENAGGIAVVNRRLKFTPWTMTAQQAQFIESRQFQIEEISRWTGVPPHLLMQTEKQTSWGTGVDEQNRGLSKFVLGHWATRFEQRASRLLANPRWCEFDFAGLERPNFETNVKLILEQIEKGLISPAYGRKLLNIPETAAPAEPETPDSAPPAGGEDDDAPAE
jgi:HK97 family phage portal protein